MEQNLVVRSRSHTVVGEPPTPPHPEKQPRPRRAFFWCVRAWACRVGSWLRHAAVPPEGPQNHETGRVSSNSARRRSAEGPETRSWTSRTGPKGKRWSLGLFRASRRCRRRRSLGFFGPPEEGRRRPDSPGRKEASSRRFFFLPSSSDKQQPPPRIENPLLALLPNQYTICGIETPGSSTSHWNNQPTNPKGKPTNQPTKKRQRVGGNRKTGE
mmetsp:Transcript_24559/g.54812  ORF Transcript_24559/g.54812 Transcript_24559/m.54812 type:complete len:213 (-) Transcript_24559:38-676(-)